MTSHEYAQKLMAVANQLLAADAFTMPDYTDNYVKNHGAMCIQFFGQKDLFLAAVRAIGSGDKRVNTTGDFALVAGGLHLLVARSSVCRIVKPGREAQYECVDPGEPAEYECEPLLSQEEADSVGVGAGPTYVEEASNG